MTYLIKMIIIIAMMMIIIIIIKIIIIIMIIIIMMIVIIIIIICFIIMLVENDSVNAFNVFMILTLKYGLICIHSRKMHNIFNQCLRSSNLTTLTP